MQPRSGLSRIVVGGGEPNLHHLTKPQYLEITEQLCENRLQPQHSNWTAQNNKMLLQALLWRADSGNFIHVHCSKPNPGLSSATLTLRFTKLPLPLSLSIIKQYLKATFQEELCITRQPRLPTPLLHRTLKKLQILWLPQLSAACWMRMLCLTLCWKPSCIPLHV